MDITVDIEWVEALGGEYWVYRCISPFGKLVVLYREQHISLKEAEKLLEGEIEKQERL